MFRYLIGAIFVLLALRFFASLARLLTAGPRRPAIDPEKRPKAKAGPRLDPKDAIDVPFTEIPPEAPR